jgi:hypothetical protein
VYECAAEKLKLEQSKNPTNTEEIPVGPGVTPRSGLAIVLPGFSIRRANTIITAETHATDRRIFFMEQYSFVYPLPVTKLLESTLSNLVYRKTKQCS